MLSKINNIIVENKQIRNESENLKKDNILLEQNLDLLNTIKDMKKESIRFQLMDIGGHLDYDK